MHVSAQAHHDHTVPSHDHSAHSLTDFAIAAGLLALLATFVVGFILEANHIHWVPEAVRAAYDERAKGESTARGGL